MRMMMMSLAGRTARSLPSLHQVATRSIPTRLSIGSHLARRLRPSINAQTCRARSISSQPLSAVRCMASSSLSATRPPAEVGDAFTAIETPALVVDLDAFERNCHELKSRMESYPTVSIRPHCKLAEVEAMVEGGVKDVLLSNELVAPSKIARLVALAAPGIDAKISVCVDDLGNALAISKAAVKAGSTIELLIDVNVGQDRCGVDDPQEVLKMAEAILEAPGVTFGGLQAYHGGIQHVRSYKQRAAAVEKVAARTEIFVDVLAMKNLPTPAVTGAGTGTYEEHAATGIFTEIQPGSFCFNDADYARNLNHEGSLDAEWEQSLWVMGTVMSRSTARSSVVLDVGTKAVSLDSGPPAVPLCQTDGVQVEFKSGGDEHGLLLWPEVWQMPAELPEIGRVMKLVPGHCDPTVNLYDWFVAVRGKRVTAVWPIRGRGPGI